MEGFVIKYTDINNLLWEYKSKLEGLISKLETCERSINQFIQSDQFIGETATAAKNYLYDVHITMISCLKVATQNMLDDIAYHKACYNEIDGSTNFRLDEEAIREFRTKLATNSADTESYAQSVQQAVSNISDISDVNTPGTNGIIELHEQLDQELLNFIETIQTRESTTVTIIENTVDLMVDSIKNCLGKIGTSKTAITTYTSNSFYTDIDVYTLAYLSEYFYQQHTVNQETYDAIWDVEQQLKDAAEEREVQGVIKAIGGIVLVVVGVACIAASLGAATPAVVAAGTMIGSGTTVFGITDTAEGAQDVYYGSISDLDSTAVNRLKEVVFQGNEEAYYFTEGVFSFAASAFIPIGKASTVGKLTFRSGSTIIAKEGLSTLAGEGVSKLTTDLSGNQTVGMMAGMLTSGLTSHGLDKLDVKFKQKSFTDLMKQGMVEKPLDMLENESTKGLADLENMGNVTEPEKDVVTYRRVQGGNGNNASQFRIEVNADGTISIPNKEANLNISIDDGEHAEYFLDRRGDNTQIVEVDVPKWFDDFLQENAVSQINYKKNPLNQSGTAPKITDISTPGNCFELPAPWIEWLEEYGTNARIISP